MNFRFRSHQKLKDASSISYVFENGKKFHYYPLLFLTAELPPRQDVPDNETIAGKDTRYPIKIAFSVPKRRVRKAVHRNRIKRQMREAYRLLQHDHTYSRTDTPRPPIGVVIIFVGKEMPDYAAIFKAMERYMERL